MTNLNHWDRLYGQHQISKQALAIYQTPQFARLNRISLSAVPTWVQTTGTCASRAEHSRGVRFLAELLTTKKSFKKYRTNLVLAATLHDIGSPPFSHLAEPFQMAITGKTHEEFSKEVMINTQIAKVIKKQGGNLDTIIDYISGNIPPISDLINGSIDLDNLDNTLRFGQSMGLIDAHLYYDPTLIVQSFKLDNGKLTIDGRYLPAINSWEKCRNQVYKFVYSHENLSPGAMLTRALYFAYQEGEITKRFFEKTDDQALNFLLGCNPRTYNLINQTLHWQFFKPVFHYQRLVNKSKDRLHNMNLGQKISDQLALELKINPEDISVLISFDKGFKQIHLPIIKNNKVSLHQPTQTPTLFINAYLNPEKRISSKKISKNIKPLLDKFELTKVD